MEVKIYSTPGCPWCHAAKEYMKEKKVKYKDFDVSADAKARDEMVKKSGQMGVPVLEIKETVIVGFDKDKIDEVLGK